MTSACSFLANWNFLCSQAHCQCHRLCEVLLEFPPGFDVSLPVAPRLWLCSPHIVTSTPWVPVSGTRECALLEAAWVHNLPIPMQNKIMRPPVLGKKILSPFLLQALHLCCHGVSNFLFSVTLLHAPGIQHRSLEAGQARYSRPNLARLMQVLWTGL